MDYSPRRSSATKSVADILLRLVVAASLVVSPRSRGVRSLLSLAVVISLVAGSVAPSFAAGGVYGSLAGTVIDAKTKAPIAGASITAVSPSQRFTAQTDSNGRFTILGVGVDTYTITVSASGHQTSSLTGVTVYGDQTNSTGAIALGPIVTTIGKVAARSSSSAYQPTQTTDTYTISPGQLVQSTGKANSTNENAALLSVPGVTLTNNSSPISTQVTIRGGAAYEVGYQYDGIPFREPFLNGNGSFGLMNGVGSVQVVEGAADATQAGVGAGVINVIPNRGSGPGTGLFDIEGGSPNRSNQYSLSYGFSTPDNHFSEYFSYTGQNLQPYYGYNSTQQYQYGNYFASNTLKNDQFLNNFFYKFGKDQNQQIQFLYTVISQEGYAGATGAGGVYNQTTNPNALVYYPYDQLTQGLWQSVAGWTPAQYSSLIGLAPGTPAVNAAISQGQQNFSNQTHIFKLEYDNNFSSSTYLALRYYNWDSLASTDDSYSGVVGVGGLGPWGGGDPGIIGYGSTGGQTTGVNFDLSHQFGSNVTVTLNGEYDNLIPDFSEYEPQLEALALAGITGLTNGPTGADWLPGGVVYDTYCGKTPYSGTGPLPSCDPRLPSWGIGYNGTQFQNWGTGLRLQYNPTSKLHLDLGARVEGQNQHWYGQLGYLGQGVPATGTCDGSCSTYGVAAGSTVPINNPYDVANTSWTNSVLHPSEVEPRGALSYQLDPGDAVRFSYGRSAVFANAQTAGTPFTVYGLAPYLNIPAKAGSTCGWTATTIFPCQTFAQQLYWSGDNLEAPDAGNGLPAIYTNYDFSYNHLFRDGLGLRITPFFKEGTSLPTFFLLNPVLGIFAVSNKGLNKTTGTELDLTTPQKAVGLSGFFAATYQNVLSTTPPFTSDENAVPSVSSASLALGDVYRAGYVSPASFRIGATENLKHGFSISPQIQFNIGYPYSIGNLIAAQLPDGSYANIPQVDFGPGITGGNGSLIGGNPGASVATNYYDPANPGSSINPNIAATRGTNATSANGGYLSHFNLSANLTLQYKFDRNTLGIQFINLFGNAYINDVPAVSPWYQPVATGLSGPQTGVNSCLNQTGTARGCYAQVPNDTKAFTNGSYLLTNGNFTGTPTLGPGQPFAVQVFFQRQI